MTGRERVHKAIRREMPDRLPGFYRGKEPDSHLFRQAFGCESMYDLVDVSPFIKIKAAKDFVPVYRGDVVYDEFGVGRKKYGYHLEIVDFPLSDYHDPRALIDYNWLDPNDAARYDHIRDEALHWKEKGKAIAAFAVPGNSVAIFEPAWYMTGLEKFLADLHLNREFACALMDILLELAIEFWNNVLERAGDLIDLACIGDDLGSQNDMIISPELYRELIKPRHKRLIDFIRSKTNAYIFYHSCGNVFNIIDDLIEIGVDVLDPVQPKAMDLAKLKREFGDRIAFIGGMDEQYTLPFGSIEEVKEEVDLRFNTIGKNGGFIIGPAHWIQEDTPDENIIAMYKAISNCLYG